MADDIPDILKPESKQQYEENANEYFQNVQSPKQRGPAADALSIATPYLPSRKVEARYADRVEVAADKTKRSGARVNKGSNVPAIFMQGMKETSELIDEFTPGKMQPQKEAKPVDEQVAPTGYFEKAEAMVEGWCLDCCSVPEEPHYVLGVTICNEEDSQKRVAIGVSHGAIVLYQICMPCFEAAKQLTRDKNPLVLVFDGEVTDEKDLRIAHKYGFPLNLHSGVEKTRGQWELAKRGERLMDTLRNYLIEQNKVSGSRVFRNRDAASVGS